MDAPKTNNETEAKLHFLDYWRVIRIRKTVILAVFLLVVLTTTAVTFLLPESWSSTVRIAVEKDVSDINPLGFAQNSQQYDPYFIQTEFEKIKSKAVLYKVIEDLDLNRKWGDRYNNHVPLKTTETYQLLSRRIDVRQTRNTTLIEVRVYSDAKEKPAEEAALIANKIADVYRDSRLNLKQAMAKRGIKALEERQAQLDEEVKLAQARVDDLRKKLKVSEFGGESSGIGSVTLDTETVRRLEGERITVEATYNSLQALLGKLNELTDKGRKELRNAILTAHYDPQTGEPPGRSVENRSQSGQVEGDSRSRQSGDQSAVRHAGGLEHQSQ